MLPQNGSGRVMLSASAVVTRRPPSSDDFSAGGVHGQIVGLDHVFVPMPVFPSFDVTVKVEAGRKYDETCEMPDPRQKRSRTRSHSLLAPMAVVARAITS